MYIMYNVYHYDGHTQQPLRPKVLEHLVQQTPRSANSTDQFSRNLKTHKSFVGLNNVIFSKKSFKASLVLKCYFRNLEENAIINDLEDMSDVFLPLQELTDL